MVPAPTDGGDQATSNLTRHIWLLHGSKLSIIAPGHKMLRRVASSMLPAGVKVRLSYRTVVKTTRRRPLELSLETTNICNARCHFCAYPKVTDTKAVMSMTLFEKICSEYEGIGGGLLGFAPLLGDPLVDPYLLKRVEIVRSNYPNIKLHTFTNGIAFTRFSDDELLFLISNLRFLNISMGGLSRPRYKEMFGVDKFEQVWQSVCRIARLAQTHNLDIARAIHFRSNAPEEITADPRYAELPGMGYQVFSPLSAFNSWGGIVTQEDLPPGATIIDCDNSQVKENCLIPNIILTILPDGNVTACGCFAVGKQFIVGNVETQSLLDVWRASSYESFKRAFSEGRPSDLCRGCSSYMSFDKLFRKPETVGVDLFSGGYWSKL